MGLLKLWVGRARRRLRSRRRLAVAGFATVGLGVAFWVGFSSAPQPQEPAGPEHAAHGVVLQALSQVDAPTLIETVNPGAAPIAYSLPEKPFRNQEKAPCKPDLGEVEINGGCWVALERRPPCTWNQAEYRGKCYLPVALGRGQREPQSLQP